MRRFLAILLISLSLFGCSVDYVERDSETAREGAYGVPAAIDNGRIDKADSISKSMQTLYGPPKTPITSNPVLDPKTGLPTVILPARLSGKVFVIGSYEYQDLLKNKAIAQQLALDNKNLNDYKVDAEKQKVYNQGVLNSLLIQYNSLKAKMDKYESSIFYKAYVFFNWLPWIALVLIIGAIVLFVFCPFLLPPFMALLGTIAGTFVNLLETFIGWVISLVKKN